MAVKPQPQDDAEEIDIDPAAGAGKPGVMRLVAIVAAALLVIGAAVGITVYLMGGEDAVPTDAVGPPPTDAKANDAKAGAKPADGQKSGTTPDQAPIYRALDPPFTVNFENAGRIHYAQIVIEVMARDQAVIDAVTDHMPLVRNNLLLRLSDLDYARINSRDGREGLRKELLEAMRESLKTETDKYNVEQLYFTSFIVQ